MKKLKYYTKGSDLENSSDEENNDEEQSDNDDNDEIKYTTDGLTRQEYKGSKYTGRTGKKLIQSECCHRFYKNNAFEHKNTYGLEIDGIETCIHCYISFNSKKFIDRTDLTEGEEDCLEYYIKNFTKEHSSIECTRNANGEKCVLCNEKEKLNKSAIVCETDITSSFGSAEKPSPESKKILVSLKEEVIDKKNSDSTKENIPEKASATVTNKDCYVTSDIMVVEKNSHNFTLEL